MKYYFMLICLLIISVSQLYAQNNFEKKWLTAFENSNYLSTANYEESIAYFKQLADYSEYAEMKEFGISPQGRKLYYLVVSKNKLFSPEEIREKNLPVVFVQNGIHSGEIEGKDACMLMLREILVEKTKIEMIENTILVIIPILNVDGHERSSRYNRINQNGPEEMGWRTTSQNYNLNRDYMKADAPEMQAWLKLYNSWLPEIFIDTHTTDGLDYQYTITYLVSNHINVPPVIKRIVDEKLLPAFTKSVEEEGFLIAPYVWTRGREVEKGIVDWIPGPRFSNGYAEIQNRIGLLIETHMLKPYKERVYSTKALIEGVIKNVNENSDEFVSVMNEADEYIINRYRNNRDSLTLSYDLSDEKYVDFLFKAVKLEYDSSYITGSKVRRYTGEPYDAVVPFYNEFNPKVKAALPEAYVIPKEYSEIAERLKLHGVKVTALTEDDEMTVEKISFTNVKFGNRPYENRFIPSFKYISSEEKVKVSAGSYLVIPDNKNIKVIANLLEPDGEDSFIKWGMLNQIFERKEYFEDYSMEPIAQQMLIDNPKLKEEFEKLLTEDKEFAQSPYRRLQFFYERSPYSDEKQNVYPILRVIEF
ncbi:MAG: M14 family metallopeptidase [Melioribacteraceae bacterium]|nr:M14 family metallopeptidase [Melioribacteraceae bacterium]MCF8352984.1 M14 family metallopeptidase [Melioribacteraceae bacterium]MCF8392875.1 M14 family metallopeptidase [Melioribacteraceae bacterium]MCF8417831.1 M14 family metallopeptidase [Melioribacteraceae bacterium]